MHLAEKKTAAVEEALRDRSLTSTEKLVLIAIIHNASLGLSAGDSALRATVTIGWLAQRTGFAVRTVQRSVGLLETRRFLRIQRSIGGGNHYTILQVKE